MRVLWVGVAIATVLVASARRSLQPDTRLQLQARVLGEGPRVVVLGGGVLGADGWAKSLSALREPDA